MTQVKGVVQAISSKDFGKGPMWSIKVDGEWYSVGKFQPKCKENDTVSFEIAYNGNYKNVAPRTLQVMAGVPVSSTGGAGNQSAGARAFDTRQDTISKQAARNTAIEMVRLMHEAGVKFYPATAKMDQQVGIIEKMVDHYTAKFYQFATGQELPETSEAESEVADGAGKIPADSAWA